LTLNGVAPPPPPPPAPPPPSTKPHKSGKDKEKKGGRFKDQVSDAVVLRLKKYMNAGRIGDSDDFRHLARKLTHLCLEKERRHAAVVAQEMTAVTPDIRRKIEKLVDHFFEKVKGTYHTS